MGRTPDVDYRAALSLVGSVLKYLAVPLVIPLVVALVYGEPVAPFVATMALTLVLGVGLERQSPDPDIGAREGFLTVGVTWVAVALVGAVPYLVEAHGVPGLVAASNPESTLGHPANALFESMSGFTTTGATVVGDISFESHTHAIMLWRQLTQWLGGMGIIVLAVAILPELSVGGAQLIEAEAPGPGIEKLTPRIANTARVLWAVYVGFTVLEMCLLYGLHLAGMAPNMGVYNAVAHPLTTMPTGGFSPEARSLEAFSAAVQWVVIPFMVAAGTNVALFWRALSDDPDRLLGDSEFRAYVGVLGAFTAVIAALLFLGDGFVTAVPAGGSTYDAGYLASVRGAVIGAIGPAVRHAAFQAAAIVTTTGYASIDFNAWSPAAQYLMLAAMFVGGSAGSTGGSVKIIRWYVVVKSLRRELFTTARPDAVRPIRLGGRVVDESAVRGIYAFTALYLVLFALAAALLSLEGARLGQGLSVLEAVSAAASTLGNVGPGFGALGPMGSYLGFSAPAKVFMTLLMWVGRLEIIPVLVLLTPEYWRT
ncbi:MAG: TrkH family potassium uptake protein [Haloferacaceae archaeon]